MDLRANVLLQNTISVLKVTCYYTEELRAIHPIWKPLAFSTEQKPQHGRQSQK